MAQICLIDEPSPFATLATWQRHLTEVRRLPDNVALKFEMLRTAEATVALGKLDATRRAGSYLRKGRDD